MANEPNARNKKKGLLDNLNPQQRRLVTLGGVVGFAVLAIVLLVKDDAPRTRNNEVTSVLTDVSSKDMGIESLLAQIKISNDNFEKVQQQIKNISREQEMTRSEASENRKAIARVSRLEKDFTEATERMSGQIQVLSEKLTKANEDNARLQRIINGSPELVEEVSRRQQELQNNSELRNFESQSVGNEGNTAENQADNGSGSLLAGRPSFDEVAQRFKRNNQKREFIDEPIDLNDPEKLFANAPLPNATTTVVGENGETVSMPTATLTTNFIAAKASEQSDEELAEEDPEMFIPAGSMMKGVLLAGLDAPTGTDARKDPFPVNIRIQTDTVLPNNYRADLKECFLLMSGYGDMSSERALLRGETLSCIMDDRSIIQAKLPSYAAGEDGKAGLRGRLVSKTGSILAKTLLAGFASGVSEAFDVSMTPTINTSSDGTVSYEQVYAPEAFQGAAISGVSNALDRLAEYYMSMAEEMFPIIEIDGGREVTIIVSNGATLTKVRDGEGKPVAKQKIITE